MVYYAFTFACFGGFESNCFVFISCFCFFSPNSWYLPEIFLKNCSNLRAHEICRVTFFHLHVTPIVSQFELHKTLSIFSAKISFRNFSAFMVFLAKFPSKDYLYPTPRSSLIIMVHIPLEFVIDWCCFFYTLFQYFFRISFTNSAS